MSNDASGFFRESYNDIGKEMMKTKTIIKSDLPEGQAGNWRIEKFEITPGDAEFANMRAMVVAIQGGGHRPVEAGTYTRLMRGGTVVMSDTPAEVSDLKYIEWRAKGNVIIGGLGMGMAVEIALSKPEVDHVTVIEISPDVISLVAGHFTAKYGDRLAVIEGDIMTWKPKRGTKYDYAWFDIWDDICTDNLDEMDILKRRYKRRGAVVDFWAYGDHLRAVRRWGR